MTENELSEDQVRALFDACQPIWENYDMAGKVWVMGPRLKPCPFCGSSDVKLHYFGDGFLDTVMVECQECGVSVHSKDYQLEEKDAVELWNRRVKE